MTLADPNAMQQVRPGRAFAWISNGRLLWPIRRVATSVIIVAGPWLLSIVALAILSARMEPLLGRDAVEDLRLNIVYALCIAPLVAGPIGAIAAQRIRESMEGEDVPECRPVNELFLTAAISAGVTSLVIAAAIRLILGTDDVNSGLAFVFLTVSTTVLWVTIAVLSALRAHAFLLSSFALGMLIALIAASFATTMSLSIEMLIWSFTSGIVFCLAMAMSRFGETRANSRGEIPEAASTLWHDLKRHRYLAAGIAFAFCGVWVDKWVLWISADGLRSESGFLHSGAYDSVMFIAHLSIIPCFAAFHLFYDEDLRRGISDVRASLTRRMNYAMFRSSVDDFGTGLRNGIFAIIFVQGTITATLILTAPILSQMMHFDFAQFINLRIGLLAVFLHSILYLSSAILLLCARHRQFAAVQLAFFCLNLVLSTTFLNLIGPSAYGILAASLVAATLSFLLASRALHRFDYLILVGENDSL